MYVAYLPACLFTSHYISGSLHFGEEEEVFEVSLVHNTLLH